MSPIVHVVFFQFRPELTVTERQELCDQMLELKNSCLHPRSEKPYIQSSVGGLDKSIEGAQGGITHAFVVQFASQEDRDYYVQEDPAHQAFVEVMVPKLVKAQIIDFSPGDFMP
ncbi:stress responsive a/B barrel domain-containing protein [Hirsutella rhossiliensis]|uniref:Stress responsive a/B barrel domain-containing protein n=1 Tax=Hirsutella rhossiliensis TaxID=111463 RepID=A0A9P8SFR7_9HYPO|nr:stress responsive a/B barrel domain-containing protein [Hirsutella rhossiliensis]KAH0959705.1 stress responsive a/B barrel domain-containing protein [Hirsutella rhossiliensis]